MGMLLRRNDISVCGRYGTDVSRRTLILYGTFVGRCEMMKMLMCMIRVGVHFFLCCSWHDHETDKS